MRDVAEDLGAGSQDHRVSLQITLDQAIDLSDLRRHFALDPAAAPQRPFGFEHEHSLQVLRHLRAHDWITPFERSSAFEYAHRTGRSVEDILIDRAILEEGTLLGVLAQLYQTQFVSLAQLSRLKVAPEVLSLVSLAEARAFGVLPVKLNRAKSVLYCVASRASDRFSLEKVLATVTGCRRVCAFVCRPEAVLAGIESQYENRPHRMRKMINKARWTKPLVQDRPIYGEAVSELYEPQVEPTTQSG